MLGLVQVVPWGTAVVAKECGPWELCSAQHLDRTRAIHDDKRQTPSSCDGS